MKPITYLVFLLFSTNCVFAQIVDCYEDASTGIVICTTTVSVGNCMVTFESRSDTGLFCTHFEGQQFCLTSTEFSSLVAGGQIAFANYMKGIGFTSSCLGGTGSPDSAPIPQVNPVVDQNILTFQNQVFSERATPGETEQKIVQDQNEEGSTVTVLTLPNMFSADLEITTFEFNDEGGNSLAMKLGYEKTFRSNYSVGGNAFLSRLSFDNRDEGISHNVINLYADKSFPKRTREFVVGGNINYLMLDDTVSESNGTALGLYASNMWYLRGGHIVTAGAMAQSSSVGEVDFKIYNLAGLYGFPISDRFALNCQFIYTKTDQDIEGKTTDFGDSDFISTGAVLEMNIAPGFGLALGVKKVFLIDHYSNTTITLGGSMHF